MCKSMQVCLALYKHATARHQALTFDVILAVVCPLAVAQLHVEELTLHYDWGFIENALICLMFKENNKSVWNHKPENPQTWEPEKTKDYQ